MATLRQTTKRDLNIDTNQANAQIYGASLEDDTSESQNN